MMLFHLIKKDVLIVKKYVLIMLAAAVLIPPFMLWRAAPFSRSMMVLSKYVFCMGIYVACCIIYGIETLFISGLGTVDITLFLFMFFCNFCLCRRISSSTI